MPTPKDAPYLSSDVFKKIALRLRDLHKLDIVNHIKNMIYVADSTGGGITFEAVDYKRLIWAIQETRAFRHDDRRDLFGGLAAAATKGEGFREIGETSLHCQIAPERCNIHIDRYGFVAVAPDGRSYYDPDAIMHIVDELLWAKVVGKAKGASPFLGDLLDLFRPILPNSTNKYRPAVGGQVTLGSGEDLRLQNRWKLTVDLARACRDSACREAETTSSVTFELKF